MRPDRIRLPSRRRGSSTICCPTPTKTITSTIPPAYAGEIEKMKRELLKLRREVGDTDAATPRMQEIMDEYYW